MEPETQSQSEERREMEQLRARLAEAEDALRAIRQGEIDALVVAGPEGSQIYTLTSADQSYRALIESMQQGAVTLLASGDIYYSNLRFASMLGLPLEQVIGASMEPFVHPEDLALYHAILERGRVGSSEGEVRLCAAHGAHVPAYLTISRIKHPDIQGTCMVVTDLTEQQRNAQLAADEQLARAILEQAAECIVVCDQNGTIIRASEEARRICGCGPLLQPFEALFPLVFSGNSATEEGGARVFFRALLARPMPVRDLEVTLKHASGRLSHYLLNAGLLVNPQVNFRGCVITLTEITERKRSEAALMESTRRKDEFLAMLAHELRNPLAPVRYAVQILNNLGLDHPVLARQRQIIDRQISHMARLLDDLLDVSRITRGKIELKRKPVLLIDAINNAVETTRPLIESRGHTLHLTPPPEELRVLGDPERLIQVVGNLLSNAAKYTEKEGQIWLEARRENGEAVIRVCDTGLGLSPEMIGCIFDLFTQGDQSLDRSQGGLGIGLTIVQQLVQLHGGTITAQSEGPGRGSEFIVRLPALPEQQPILSASKPAEDQVQVRALRILVVDDVTDSAASLAELLEIWKHQVRVAYGGAAALELARQFQPEVVLLDIGMPVLDGFEVARRLRAEHGDRPMLLVALSGYGQDCDRQRSREAGFDNHLVKPVDLGALSSLLASVFA